MRALRQSAYRSSMPSDMRIPLNPICRLRYWCKSERRLLPSICLSSPPVLKGKPGGIMKIGIRVLPLFFIFFLAGCATAMSERASRVQVISASEAREYQFVANLSASSSLTGVARYTGYQNALNELLDKAAAAGAEFVVLDPKSGPSYWTTSEVVRGTAYKRHR